MADNYLEKQYESYEARKAAWEKAKKSGRDKNKHKLMHDLYNAHPQANGEPEADEEAETGGEEA